MLAVCLQPGWMQTEEGEESGRRCISVPRNYFSLGFGLLQVICNKHAFFSFELASPKTTGFAFHFGLLHCAICNKDFSL